MLYALAFVAGGAVCSAASWFYYSHAVAAKVTAELNSLKATVADVVIKKL